MNYNFDYWMWSACGRTCDLEAAPSSMPSVYLILLVIFGFFSGAYKDFRTAKENHEGKTTCPDGHALCGFLTTIPKS